MCDSPYYVRAESVAGLHGLSDPSAPGTIGHSQECGVAGVLLRAAAGGEQRAIGLVEDGPAHVERLHEHASSLEALGDLLIYVLRHVAERLYLVDTVAQAGLERLGEVLLVPRRIDREVVRVREHAGEELGEAHLQRLPRQRRLQIVGRGVLGRHIVS